MLIIVESMAPLHFQFRCADEAEYKLDFHEFQCWCLEPYR